MSCRVWVKCITCGSENGSITIIDKISNERDTCPGCNALWQESRIVAKVNFSEKTDHVIWM